MLDYTVELATIGGVSIALERSLPAHVEGGPAAGGVRIKVMFIPSAGHRASTTVAPEHARTLAAVLIQAADEYERLERGAR